LPALPDTAAGTASTRLTASARASASPGATSDTFSLNLAASGVYDPKTGACSSSTCSTAGEQNGELNLDKTSAELRYEHTLSDRLFAFAQVAWLRDKFKEISYLIAPTAGVGYKILKTDAFALSAEAGIGGFFEKNPERGVPGTAGYHAAQTNSAFSVRAAEAFAWKISKTASLGQAFSGLWKADDFGDAYYRNEIFVSAAITKNSELKVGYTTDYKTRPPDPALKKSDSSLVAAFVMKL
jgi:putative salt-induced outer membrane protein YdiY